MRDHGIEAFEYPSARSSEALVQVAVLTPAVFQSTRFDHVEITAELSADYISIPYHNDGQLHPYTLGGCRLAPKTTIMDQPQELHGENKPESPAGIQAT